MKDLKLICVQPSNYEQYGWQAINWLNSAREFGLSGNCQILLFETEGLPRWDYIKGLFPEVQFYSYKGTEINHLINTYIPVLRPYTLKRHWEVYPELENSTIFYHDCDILLTGRIPFEDFQENCYVSDCKGYISATYFNSKVKDVLPGREDIYKKIDVIHDLATICGIDKGTIESNTENSGGAQYILNGITSQFWDRMIRDCINIYNYLGNVNREYFESENKGFQRWCADMWALLYGLWREGKRVSCPKELDFAWSTDLKTKLGEVNILHNAGITSDSKMRVRWNKTEIDAPTFYKGRYVNSVLSPFRDDPYVNKVLTSEVTKDYCNHYYLQKLMECRDKYNLT